MLVFYFYTSIGCLLSFYVLCISEFIYATLKAFILIEIDHYNFSKLNFNGYNGKPRTNNSIKILEIILRIWNICGLEDKGMLGSTSCR